MCIDICPVGALTSGAYRYQTRPWEMEHVGTICTHCSDGCKTTLGVRNDQIIRGNNRDRSGINGEFLCIKGRYAFDFYDHAERLQSPADARQRQAGRGLLVASARGRGQEVQPDNWPMAATFGVIGSNHTTNEENYLPAEVRARSPAHQQHRSPPHRRCRRRCSTRSAARPASWPRVADLYDRKAFLILGADLALEHPFLSFQIRANYRHHQAHVYVVHRQARARRSVRHAQRSREAELEALEDLRDKLKAEPELVILFNDSVKGDDIAKLVEFGESLGIPVKYICLVDYSNSRGAIDMGLMPDCCPATSLPSAAGLTCRRDARRPISNVLWVVGANPLKDGAARRSAGFLVVQDMFLTETAQQADVVLPAASAYEKNGTVTNVCGEVQRLKKAINTMGAKPDLEIMGLIASEMGVAAALGPWVAGYGFRRDPQARSTATIFRSRDRHRRRGADHAGERTNRRRAPSGSGPLRPQRLFTPVRWGGILRY